MRKVDREAGLGEEPGDGVVQTFDFADIDRWRTLTPHLGEVLVVELSGSSFEVFEEVWAPFLVIHVAMGVTGGLSCQVKSLGVEEERLNKTLSSLFNRKTGTLHLCNDTPCSEPEGGTIHVKTLKKFSLEEFSPNLSASQSRQAQKWLDAARKAAKGGEGEPDKEAEPNRKGKKDKEEADRPGGIDVDASKIEALRKKKAKEGVKAKLAGVRPDTGSGQSSSSSGTSSSESSKARDTYAQEEMDGLRAGARLEGRGRSKGAIKDGTTKSYADQLALKAQEKLVVTQRTKGQEASGSSQKSLLAALNVRGHQRSRDGKQGASPAKKGHHQKSQSRGRSTSSSRGRKKRKRGKGSPSPGGSSSGGGKKKNKSGKKKKRKSKKVKKKKRKHGRHRSCSNSSSSSSRRTRSSDSALELEAPLRKKSREEPGSVLAMLIEHVRAQLEQGAQLDMLSHEKHSLTSGIRILTHLNLFIRPNFPGAMKEIRELHVLASAMDVLRLGSLGRLGDILAGRYIALHQSLLDSGWGGARRLEVAPLEDGSAISDGLLLRARKHQRLVLKSQGADFSWGQGRGRGKGGRTNNWSQWQQESESWKGGKSKEKGKRTGKKGKKGQDNSGKHSEWKESQEKPGERPT